MSKVKALIGGVLGLSLVGTVVIWAGAYNVAATVPHFDITKWFFGVVRDRSIAIRVETITPPAELHARLDMDRAVRSFHDMCVGCHAAPGLEPSFVREGLNPEPPRLGEERVQERSDAELFWIIAHGIKMTGMPALAPTHADEDIWELVAFLRKLPKMNPQEYQALMAAAGIKEGEAGHSHDHSHAPAEDARARKQA